MDLACHECILVSEAAKTMTLNSSLTVVVLAFQFQSQYAQHLENACLDAAWDRDPFSETVSLQCLRDPPDRLFILPSDGLLNFRCSVSMKLSLLAFCFTSLDDDFHHEGMFFIFRIPNSCSFRLVKGSTFWPNKEVYRTRNST
uniref:Mitogen-activated protein kinase kinase kinase YODA-like isoform X2 n=1 Tax=Rhizophora mucronata TaxID=61149 RepID=A0A2P2MV60_RHIMU